MTVLTLPQALVTREPEVLRSITNEACNLAIWKRSPLPGAASLLHGKPQNIRFHAMRTGFAERLARELGAHAYHSIGARDAFVADVTGLANLYCDIMSYDRVELRLEIITTDSCRKFHADYVSARLITTYVGAGTDWIDAQDAARLAGGGEPRTVHSLDAGDVGLFKGRLAARHPAIHRSPPIAGSGDARLLLVLNPVEQAEGVR